MASQLLVLVNAHQQQTGAHRWEGPIPPIGAIVELDGPVRLRVIGVTVCAQCSGTAQITATDVIIRAQAT